MSVSTEPEKDKQSFAEAALRLSGKSDEEARRTGALDTADDQVEKLFLARHQTSNSPIHRAVWESKTPLELFSPPPLAEKAPCDVAMEKSIEIVKRYRAEKKLYNDKGKLCDELLSELGTAGYWGMLISPEYGGQGAPFPRFVRFLTKLATIEATVPGMASVHGCIGAVDPVRTFGNEEQKKRILPRLATGEALSGFALTEPGAGSDLTALKTVAIDKGDYFEVSGEKLFITNAYPGRTVGLVCLLEGKKPAVLIADLPKEENEQFQLVKYNLWALKRCYNQGMKFDKLRVPKENLLTPDVGDGLTIAYHGLNLGRLALSAGASGNMRVMLANMLPWSQYRRTYGQPIITRELVKRRIARLAGLIAGADAITQWGAWLIEEGYRGELECIIAKVFGSEAQKEAAVELFMKTHGGRSFLHGHMFGDEIHEFLAPCIYEGEGEVLGLAFFKSIVKEHGKQFLEPIGKAAMKHGIKAPNPMNPIHAWKMRKEFGSYAKWMVQQRMTGSSRQSIAGMSQKLSAHVDFAQEQFGKMPLEISGVVQKHQLKLADRQNRMAEVSQRLQDTVLILVTAIWGHQQKNEVAAAAADILCQDLRRKLTGKRPSDAYFKDVTKMADMVIEGGFEPLTGVAQHEIMMQYQQ